MRKVIIIYLISLLSIIILSNCDHIGQNPTTTDESGENWLYYAEDSRGGQGGDYYPGQEKFGEYIINPFVKTTEDNLSTFGIDVDAGSYTFGRKKINEGQLPPKESVRIEEYINYFHQDYESPTHQPFSVYIDAAPSPFRGDSLHLVRIGLKGKELSDNQLRNWNLTFLLDISGSMTSRLDLVKNSMYKLIDNMKNGDKISVCTYAGEVGTVLTPTPLSDANDKEAIKGMIADLTAGGSTAMASGIQNAYNVNMSGFLNNGVNRVIICSDGDANVGATSQEEIHELIKSYVEKGITLSALGFGQGNYNDYLMEQLANKGNGNYYYIDSEAEAERLFTEELISVMEVIAKDVKIQVEFDRESVIRYRLIGYENRAIADEDFEDETTDAGEIGAGHRVTALYEVELVKHFSSHYATVHLRYKLPNSNSDILLDVNLNRNNFYNSFSESSNRFQFTAGVAEFAEILRESPYVQTSINDVEELISQSLIGSDDRDVEFLELIRKIQTID